MGKLAECQYDRLFSLFILEKTFVFFAFYAIMKTAAVLRLGKGVAFSKKLAAKGNMLLSNYLL